MKVQRGFHRCRRPEEARKNSSSSSRRRRRRRQQQQRPIVRASSSSSLSLSSSSSSRWWWLAMMMMMMISFASVRTVRAEQRPLRTVRRYEAEKRTSQYDTAISNERPGAHYDYVDFGSTGSYIEFDDVYMQGGRYDLRFKYANANREARPVEIFVNGRSALEFRFRSTGDWSTWAKVTTPPVNLRDGRNTIRIVSLAEKGAPNLDYFVVRKSQSSDGTGGGGGGSSSGAGGGTGGGNNDDNNKKQDPNKSPPRPPPPPPPRPSPAKPPPSSGDTRSGGKFTIALYPDLQKLTMSNREDDGLDDITKFIVAKRKKYNIRMALAVGDLVNVAVTCRHQSRWDRLLRNVHWLDRAKIPFIPTCGNHDGCQSNYGHPDDYNAQFTNNRKCRRKPYDVAKRNPYFAGQFHNDGTSKFTNSYYLFEHGGKKFIIVSLRYGTSDVLTNEWKRHTNKILSRHRDRYAIILTHEAHKTHRKYACQHRNVHLILQGHRHGGRKRELIKCKGGHRIQRFVFAFRHDKSKWIQEASAARLFTFDLAKNRISMTTYSTYEKRWLKDKSACGDRENQRLHCDQYSWTHKF